MHEGPGEREVLWQELLQLSRLALLNDYIDDEWEDGLEIDAR